MFRKMIKLLCMIALCLSLIGCTSDKTPQDEKIIDMVVVPGVAFDEKRNRIGFGAGYYDSFLKNTKKECHKVGIAFEIQICPYKDYD